MRNKKGFTIVELVIVIAVVAILAAVLIPTFSSVIDKANQSKDTQLVRNLNTSLALDVGNKHNTMQDALDAVAQQGYDLDKINASAMQAEILWDSHNDAFVYLTGEGHIQYLPEVAKDRDATDVELWQICKEMPQTQKYSIYAGNGWNTTNVDGLKVGFDAGTQNITNVKYIGGISKQTVVIRTNGGKLTIDAEKDTVNHYAMLNEVSITNIAPNDCYHEYGTVKGQLNIAKGKVVLESKANVGFVNVTATSADAIAVEIKSGADYGRLTCEDVAILDAVATAANIPAEKKMQTVEGTVAIVDGVAYTTLSDAINAFKNDNSVFELFADIVNNDMNTTKKVNMPAGATFDGHGNKFNGNVSISINKNGGTVKNTSFYMIANNAAVDEKTQEYYQMEKARGELSAIYCKDLQGEAVIQNCSFDSIDWDAILISPVAGAKIEITNNVFRTSNTSVNQQMRFIHVQSKKNTDFSFKCYYNDFYDMALLNQKAIEVYYPKTKDNFDFKGNYFDGVDVSKNYTADECHQTVAGGHISCVGYGTEFKNYSNGVLKDISATPNN